MTEPLRKDWATLSESKKRNFNDRLTCRKCCEVLPDDHNDIQWTLRCPHNWHKKEP